MKSWQDFEYVTLATLPMFLFSTTFYPLSVYPRPIQLIVDCTPLYQGIALLRGLTLGYVGPGLLWHVLYLLSWVRAGSRSPAAGSAGCCCANGAPRRTAAGAPIKITRGSRRQPAVRAARAVEARRPRARASSARCAGSGRRRHPRRCRDAGGEGVGGDPQRAEVDRLAGSVMPAWSTRAEAASIADMLARAGK